MYDLDGDGSITVEEFTKVLAASGNYLSREQVIRLMSTVDIDGSGAIEFPEFVAMMIGIKSGTTSSKIAKITSDVQQSQKGGFSQVEKEGIVEFINESLSSDTDLSHMIPINPRSKDIFDEVSDGVLIGKLLERYFPGKVNGLVIKRQLNGTEVSKNFRIVLSAAREVGCLVSQVRDEDIIEGKKRVIMYMLWQIVRSSLMSEVGKSEAVEALKPRGQEWGELPPEQVLLRWINYHLRKQRHSQAVINFGSSLENSEALIYLLSSLSSQCDISALKETDKLRRAELLLQNAAKLGCRRFVSASDIVGGNKRLMSAFLAQLFLKHPAVDTSGEEEKLQKEVSEYERRVKKADTERERLQKVYSSLKSQVDREKRERRQLEAYLKRIEATLFDGVTPEEHKMLKEIMKKYMERGGSKEANVALIQGIKAIVQQRVQGMKENLTKLREEKAKIIKESNSNIEGMKSAHQNMLNELSRVRKEKEETIRRANVDREALQSTLKQLSSQVAKLKAENRSLGTSSSSRRDQLEQQQKKTNQEIAQASKQKEKLMESALAVKKELQKSRELLSLTKKSLNEERLKMDNERDTLINEYDLIHKETEELKQKSSNDQEVLAQTLQDISMDLSSAKQERDQLIQIIQESQQKAESEQSLTNQEIEEHMAERDILVQTMHDLESEIEMRKRETEEILETREADTEVKRKITELEEYAIQLEAEKQRVSEENERESEALRLRIAELEDELQKLENDIDLILGGTGSLEERLRREIEGRNYALKRAQEDTDRVLQAAERDKANILSYVESSLGMNDKADWAKLLDPEGGSVVLGRKKWLKRWMVLFKGQVSLFKLPDDPKPEFIVYLDEARIVKASKSRAGAPNCIELRTPSDVYVVQCNSESEQSDWFRLMRKAKRTVDLESKVRSQKAQQFQRVFK